jgi:class 3 adenylate cyclase
MARELVRTDRDPFAVAARSRRRFLRLVFPFLTALLLVAAIVLITLYTERVNRRDALALTEEVVAAIEEAVRLEVRAYLSPTAAAVRLLAEAVAARGIDGRLPADRSLERQMRGIMGATPELASIFVGDGEGDFLMVQRDGATLRTKLIRAGDGARVVRWVERDADGALSAAWLDPDDPYDPRERPWFDAALASEAVAWSDVYRFFTTGAPGVTASFRAPSAADLAPTVVGADLEIAEIGRFLGDLEIGTRGRAIIVTPDGGLVAYPAGLAPEDFEEVPAVGEIDDAVLREMFQRFRINRAARGIVVIDGVRHLASAAPLAEVVGRDWWVLLVAPEEDFIGFVATNARTSLALSGVVVLLATAVAILLTLQGMQSDARAARALRSEDRVRAQADTLKALAAVDGLADPDDAASLRRFATIAADAFAARRTSIWRLNADHTALACLESYDRERGAHTVATTLRADHLGPAWSRLTGPERFTTSDDGDPALRPLRELYLDGVGTTRLDAVPVRSDGRVLGALWLEDVDPEPLGPTATGIEALMARLLVPRLEALTGGEAGAPTSPRETDANVLALDAVSARREAHLLRALGSADALETVAPALVPRLAVAHVQLGDDVALARTDAADGACALHQLAATIRDEAGRHGIEYWRLGGDVVVAAVEASERDGAAATQAVADFALALQPACRDVARAAGRRTGFRSGIDVGPAFAAKGASGPDAAVIWGESCRLAARMAESAPASAIQITEAAYPQLARDYLLRRRGSFFVDEVGEIATYILAGRL